MGDDKDLDLDELLGTLSGALAEPEGKPWPELNLVPRSGVYVMDTINVAAIGKRTGLSSPPLQTALGYQWQPSATGSGVIEPLKGQPRFSCRCWRGIQGLLRRPWELMGLEHLRERRVEPCTGDQER
ncbi:hypothetical protein MAE02_65050 [Microvirga aerophila]|uniref:Uncharacterized protein n=1 Tax=Microvirga aerophila TaxID=670291 RepID=A0A512C3L3_9HYPH|nr:hypothetical protein MAE02_65050 [Microvirga aerophila]